MKLDIELPNEVETQALTRLCFFESNEYNIILLNCHSIVLILSYIQGILYMNNIRGAKLWEQIKQQEIKRI